MHRRPAPVAPVALLALVAAVLVGGMPSFSTAMFTASSTSTASVRAAADWTPPTVSLQDPGSTVKDTVTLTAQATDAETGIASVSIQHLAANGTSWTTVCTTTTASYSCSWNTKAVADGGYSLRATATDGAGYTTVSATRATTVANDVLVVLAHPGDVIRGTVPLTATVHNGGLLTTSIRTEYAPTGTTQWKSLCTGLLSNPATCSWNTTTVPHGEYDLRAVATVGTTTYTSAIVSEVLVDNLAPSVTMTDPGSPLRGTVTLAGSAVDTHSGVATVALQYAVQGTSAWTTACTLVTEPYSCRFDTTRLTDGTHAFRAVATDVAGNTTISATVGNRVVDNTVSAVSVEDPGAYLSGAVTVTATASSTAGITSVRIQRTPAGTATWTDLCTDTTAPYSCSWDTIAGGDGLYDLRAVLVDGAGRTTVSATVTSRRVDNSPLRGHDLQTTTGGAIAGRTDAGDSLVLTYTELVDLTTVTSGWNGSALSVSVRLRDGNLVGSTTKNDQLDVLRNGAAVNLGSVNLREDYVKGGKTATFTATMTATTVTVDGVDATRVTLVLGSLASGSGLRTVSNPSAMVWSPSASARDLSGRAASTAPVTEPGTHDREF